MALYVAQDKMAVFQINKINYLQEKKCVNFQWLANSSLTAEL